MQFQLYLREDAISACENRHLLDNFHAVNG